MMSPLHTSYVLRALNAKNSPLHTMTRNTLGLLLLLLLTSCIDRIDLGDDVADLYRQQLYIEGRIMSGANSVFYVQRTIPMSQNNRNYVEDAELRIVSDQGFVSDAATLTEDHAYVISTGTLNDTEHYKLVAAIDGETYESDYLTLQPSLPIDSVWFTEHAREHLGYNIWTKNHIDIHVAAHGDEHQARHYMWTWEEDYEFHAPYDISSPIDGYHLIYSPDIWLDVVPGVKNPYYYCWKHGESTDYNLYSTENLAQNVVSDVVVASFGKDSQSYGGTIRDGLSPRFSYLYAITVHQSTLDSTAYSYYRQMEQYTEEMGGLFSPTPYDLYGNLHCTSHPEVRVRGNVVASQVSNYRLFIDRKDVGLYVDYRPMEPLRKNTAYTWPNANELRQLVEGGDVLGSLSPNNYAMAEAIFYRPCLDCRMSPGATKQKPAWWPNDDE